MVGRCDSSEVLVSSRVRSEMCCVDRRTGFALVFVGIVVCALLSICSVALPGLAVKETEGHSMQFFFFFTCFNDTVSMSGWVVGDLFETRVLCVCVYIYIYICVCVCVCVCAVSYTHLTLPTNYLV